MANEPMDALRAEPDTVKDGNVEAQEKPPMDERDVAPASTRRKLWYVVRAGLAIAFLWLLLWIGVMETVRVMKRPGPCPPNCLKDAFGGLRLGMNEDDACAVVDRYVVAYFGKGLPFLVNGESVFGPNVFVDWVRLREGKIEPDGSWRLNDGRREKTLRWEWNGPFNVIGDHKWIAELTLCFEDGKLVLATYSPWLVSHRTDEHLLDEKKQ